MSERKNLEHADFGLEQAGYGAERFLIAESVSLTLPTYGADGANAAARVNSDTPNSRIIRNSKGHIRRVQILKNISFRLQNGDRLAILGANGSGKTTLLQVLSGAIPPEDGRVLCRGKPTSLININLGMQMEASGHRNITLRGLAAGYTHKEIDYRRKEIEDFTELGDFLNLPVSTYSSGMRMRLSFAIVTAFDPEILILDEWLSAGDASFKEKATARMREFANRAGIVVLASHNRSLLNKTCSLALWLDQGEIAAFGEIAEVFERYQQSLQPTNS